MRIDMEREIIFVVLQCHLSFLLLGALFVTL